ncbi:ABC transporter permease [bacterium]|nr:ABC transporter permease [bacterium]
MEKFWKEIQFALRMLRKSPGFTVVAVLTLALGIGANTAMFSVIRAVMLKPLPYNEPENLFRLSGGTSYPDLQDLKQSSKSIKDIGGYRREVMDLTSGRVPERIEGAAVTGDFFRTLGIQPQKGRVIGPNDDIPGGAKIVLISDAFWKNYMAGDPDVIGKSVSIASIPYTVIGVLPPTFELPNLKAQMFSPIRAESSEETNARGAHTMRVVVRLATNVIVDQAQSEFNAIAKRLEKQYPEENTDVRFVLNPWQQFLVKDVQRALLILLVAVGFVLLIACTNVANLFLARATEREKEMAIRAALGAGRASLLRQLIVEGVVLAIIGGFAGLFIASWISDFAVRLGPENIPRLQNTRFDFIVFAVTLGLSVFTGLLFSLAPGLHASKINLEESLRESGRATGSRTRQRMRNVLATLEIALAIVLLIGAGLLIRSFWSLQNVRPGFRTDHVLTMNFLLPLTTYADIDKRSQFFEQVLQRIKNLPGVESVGSTSELPFGTGSGFHNLAIEGRRMAVGKEPEIYARSISPDYFHTLGIAVLQGRVFSMQDRKDTLPVAIVNEKFVRRFFPQENSLGKRIAWARADAPIWMTIVGVVSDVKSFGLDLEEEPAVYTPFTQEPRFWKTWMNMVVRTSVDPSSLIATIQKEVARVDKNVPVADLLTMDALISESIGERRFHLLLLGLFAGLALLLAGVGIYGILSYNVRQRTQEMGIRMALGASQREILRLILSQGIRLVVLGAFIGIGAALAVTRFLQSLLYAVGSNDLLTFLIVPLIVIGVALLACYAPAKRATRVNPVVALRYE